MLQDIFVEGNLIYILFLAIAIIAFHLKKVWLRYVVMLASLALIGFLQMGCPSPIRAIQEVAANITNLASVVPFAAKIGIVLVAAVFYGKIFCGWVCPKGTIQEFLYQKKLRVNVPAAWDRWLRKLKYVLLAALIALPLVFHYKPVTSEISPFAALFNLSGGTFAVIFLGLILLASLFIYRPYCRYVCPTGALLGLAALISPLKFAVNACTGCQLACRKCEIGALQCPTEAGGQAVAVDKGECLVCGECRGNCPRGISMAVFGNKS